MNIQIGENTYNQNTKSTSDYGLYTYSKESVYKNDGVKKSDVKGVGALFGDAYGMAASQQTVAVESEKAAKSMASIPDSKLQKDYMVVMSNTMSEGDFAELEKNGFNVGDMEPGEIVTISDRIKTTMAKSGQVISGYNDDLNPEMLEEITGSQVYAEAIAESFSASDVPFTEDNISEARDVLDMASKLEPLDADTIRYMAVNNMEPSIENLYIAQHSTKNISNSAHNNRQAEYYMDKSGYVGKVAEAQDLADLESTVSNIVESTTGKVTDEDMKLALDMVKQGISLTQDSFELYKELNNISLPLEVKEVADNIADAIKNGKRPAMALVNEKDLLDEARALASAAQDITEEDIENVLAKDQPLTLRSLENASPASEVQLAAVSEKSMATAQRLVAEIRLSMTVSSTYVLLKNNIHVDTTELGKLVEELKEAENRQFESVFGKQYVADKEKLTSLFDETTSKINEMKDMPIAMTGRFVARSITLNVVYSEGLALKNSYQAASMEYEKMFTEVRADLGDSIRKAFRNSEDILREMGLEASDDNARAVRILGYNQMEITEASIDNVKEAVNKVQNVIEKMHPANTLRLIREGINPLEVDLDELQTRLNAMDSEVSEPQRFSVFLNKLDEAGAITEDERQSFIGIYRLINSIEKNDSAAVGSLINSRAEINFSNLLSAVRSGKHKNMDYQIGDQGEIEQLISKGQSISEQIGKAYHNKSLVQDSRAAGAISENARLLLQSIGLKGSVDNMLAAGELAGGQSRMYADIKKNLRESRMPEFKNIIKKGLASLTDKDTAEQGFAEMSERLSELVNSETSGVTETIDLKSMAFSLKQMFVASRLTRDEYYQVPMEVGEELSQVNVRITHGTDKGVRISFTSEVYGAVSGRFRPGNNGFEGLFQVDERGSQDINDMKETLLANFSEASLNVSSISFDNSSRINLNVLGDMADTNSNTDEDSNISTESLYQLAKVFIETLGSVR